MFIFEPCIRLFESSFNLNYITHKLVVKPCQASSNLGYSKQGICRSRVNKSRHLHWQRSHSTPQINRSALHSYATCFRNILIWSFDLISDVVSQGSWNYPCRENQTIHNTNGNFEWFVYNNALFGLVSFILTPCFWRCLEWCVTVTMVFVGRFSLEHQMMAS